MKKVLIGLAVVIVLLVGGVFLVFSNLDAIVESAIETAGSQALGTQVEVGRVELSLTTGAASIYDFSIANPPGFSNAQMISFDELSVAINLQNTSGDQVHINSVIARSPHVLYETNESTSNVDTISARFESEEDVAETDTADADINLIIDSILIEDIQGTLYSSRLPNPVEVSLGNIQLANLEGSPDALASEIMAPVMAQIAAAATQALVQATAELLSGVAEEVEQRVEEALEDVSAQVDTVTEQVDAVTEQAEEALESVGNLFRRD